MDQVLKNIPARHLDSQVIILMNASYLCRAPLYSTLQSVSSKGPFAPFLFFLLLFLQPVGIRHSKARSQYYLFVKCPFSRKTPFSPAASAKNVSCSGWIFSRTGATSSLPRTSSLNLKQYGLLKLPRLLLFPEEEIFHSPQLNVSYLNPLPL